MNVESAESMKVFFSIGEVADMFGESTSLIRFWSNRFSDIIKPHKNKKGNRLFTKNDVENIKIIYFLVKEKGMKLDGVHKFIVENKTDSMTNIDIIKKLENIKQLLLDVKNNL